jgi:hypothetical protein
MVPGTADSGAKVKKALMILPDQVAKDLEPEWFVEGENIRIADAFIVGIMLNANGQTFDTLKQYVQTVDVDGVNIRTVSLKGLLLTKKTMREKDLQDCVVIERAIAALEDAYKSQPSDDGSSV